MKAISNAERREAVIRRRTERTIVPLAVARVARVEALADGLAETLGRERKPSESLADAHKVAKLLRIMGSALMPQLVRDTGLTGARVRAALRRLGARSFKIGGARKDARGRGRDRGIAYITGAEFWTLKPAEDLSAW